ncbi:acetylornithine deacetylase [Roseibium aggregatum IAM 12614]|uniref:Acetylornithine deacetylase n=1 Tax=Roseibium aggregatum (strain ATCC 25650 / DSM 13394 / JCM 20685 / NBRC 16684 / NCIMB 2208 / IAM 12614 / B1) TaxID=384765 RepID=A0NZD1_ROSAI|nr:acetylornithine deacetylase [Roseibium aggregatum]EAV41810.1 acetylornithine deacetylase [Roseibium aggregatum IAM 12614]
MTVATSQEVPGARRAEAILADLVAIAGLPGAPNHQIAEYVRNFLAGHGVECAVLPGPEGDRVNLFATIGPKEVPGYVLSGHMDVVPVDGQVWTADPFRLSDLGGRLTGRGTSDMKGFLACVLAMVPEFRKSELKRPVHIAFSYDEEIGCRGVPHLIAELPKLCALPAGCIVGEPSDMHPVLSHKGKQAMEITFTGKAAHSSQPALGENALYAAAELLLFIRDLSVRMERNGPFDTRFDPPSSTVVAGLLSGGTAVNIIPDQCRLSFEVRSVPGIAPQDVSARVLERMDLLVTASTSAGGQLAATHRELASYPALPPSSDAQFIQLIEGLSCKKSIQSVSYGTEAGLFHAAGIPSIVCGPGSITRAHRPDEYILREELAECTAMLARLSQALESPAI